MDDSVFMVGIGTRNKMTPIVAVALLLKELFAGRHDVYAVKWTGKNRRKGYSPACANDWKAGPCQKVARRDAGDSPAGACKTCKNKRWKILDRFALASHLQGAKTLGVYLLRPDGKCKIGVIDLDDHDSEADPENAPMILGARLVDAAKDYGLTLFLEKSGGGRGAHVWLLLEEWTEAAKVREVLYGLIRAAGIKLTKDIEVFPKQDILGADGLGSLIALPLQGPMADGRSMFHDSDTLMPITE